MHSVSVGKVERKKTLGKPRHRWEDNIIVDLKHNCRAHLGLI
jgi:hypothetical protein